MRIRDKIDSDHHPLEVSVKREVGRKRKGTGGKKIRRRVWNEQGRMIFRQKVGRVELGEGELLEEWGKIEGRIKEALRGWKRI